MLSLLPHGRTRPDPNWSLKVEWCVVSLVCLGSFFLRLYVLRFHPFLTWDGAFYINYFRDVAWQSVFHPGYPLFVELFRLIVPDGVRAAQMVSVVSGSLLPLPLYFLARRFLSSWMALAVVAVVILMPLVIQCAVVTMSESLFVFFELSAFLLYVRRRPLLFGVSSASAYLTRPEALLFFGVLLVYEVVTRREWMFLGLVGAAFIVCALPYISYLRIQTGEWTISPKTENIRVWDPDWHLNVAREASATKSWSWSERLESSIRVYPNRLIAYANLLLYYAGFPLVLLGLCGIVWKRNILLAGLPMLLALPLFGLMPSERMVVPYIPFFAIFALLLLSSFRSWIVRSVGFLLIVGGYASTAAYATTPEEGITEFCTAGIAISPLVRPGDIFVDRKPYTAFYAGGRFVLMPNDPVDSILAFSRRIKAKYLVVSARVVRVYRPQLNFLLYSDTTLSHLHLKTAYVDGLDSGYGIRIIQLAE